MKSDQGQTMDHLGRNWGWWRVWHRDLITAGTETGETGDLGKAMAL